MTGLCGGPTVAGVLAGGAIVGVREMDESNVGEALQVGIVERVGVGVIDGEGDMVGVPVCVGVGVFVGVAEGGREATKAT